MVASQPVMSMDYVKRLSFPQKSSVLLQSQVRLPSGGEEAACFHGQRIDTMDGRVSLQPSEG